MESINISEEKSNFSQYISRAAAGERFIIQRRERPIAALISVNEMEKLDEARRITRRLAHALGQQVELLNDIEAGEIHPAMAAFGLWKEEEDLATMEENILRNRRAQSEREELEI